MLWLAKRFYTTLIDWIDWAAQQIAAGALQPGGPLRPATSAIHSA
jgi:hypothetical protein